MVGMCRFPLIWMLHHKTCSTSSDANARQVLLGHVPHCGAPASNIDCHASQPAKTVMEKSVKTGKQLGVVRILIVRRQTMEF